VIKVYPSAPYHYEVTGESEKEAAAEFQERLDRMERSWGYFPQPEESRIQDVADLRREICEKYGVTIR
jgi:hypothetical protein